MPLGGTSPFRGERLPFRVRLSGEFAATERSVFSGLDPCRRQAERPCRKATTGRWTSTGWLSPLILLRWTFPTRAKFWGQPVAAPNRISGTFFARLASVSPSELFGRATCGKPPARPYETFPGSQIIQFTLLRQGSDPWPVSRIALHSLKTQILFPSRPSLRCLFVCYTFQAAWRKRMGTITTTPK